MSLDGTLVVRKSATGTVAEAAELGIRLASTMLDEGAADLMTAPLVQGPPVRNQHA
jgi:hydroxymethylbilane synthase